MAIFIRPAIPYTVTTIPANGIVTQPAFQGLEDAATSIHQRGKQVVSLHAGIENGVIKPILGYKIGGIDHTQLIGPFRSVCPKFSIPSGYNRFSLMVRRCMPIVRVGNPPRAAEIQSTVNFLGGKGDRYEIFTGGNTGPIEYYQIFQGELPFAANVGTMTTAYLELTFGIVALDGTPSMGEWLVGSGVTPPYIGFRSLSLTLYRDDQC